MIDQDDEDDQPAFVVLAVGFLEERDAPRKVTEKHRSVLAIFSIRGEVGCSPTEARLSFTKLWGSARGFYNALEDLRVAGLIEKHPYREMTNRFRLSCEALARSKGRLSA